MKRQLHVNLEPGSWYRATNVHILDDGRLYCELDARLVYNLLDAYKKTPHVTFLRLATEKDLIQFVQTWGPLYWVHRSTAPSSPVLSKKEYWAFHRWLGAVVKLLNAVKRSEEEREALLEFVNAEEGLVETGPGYRPGDKPLLLTALKVWTGQGNPIAWIERSDTKEVRKTLQSVLESITCVKGAGFRIGTEHGRSILIPRWKVDTLKDALLWMVWYDEWRKRPLQFCQECNEPFQSDTAHQRRYCSPECGHRVASRNHARKRRARTTR